MLITSTSLSLPVVLAAGEQFVISGQTAGHSGTAFHITGTGFTPDGAYNLYATTNAASCTTGDPGTLGLQVFTPATVIVTRGGFGLDLTWPAGINQPATYYLCLANTATVSLTKTLSSNTFTLVAAPTLDITPDSVTPGQSVILTGSNWLPAQQLDVSVVVDNSGAPPLVENANVMPDSTGYFSIPLTIPNNAMPLSYAIRAYAVNDQALSMVKNDSLTIVQPSPTSTPTVQPSPSPSPTPTAQPSPSPIPTSTPTPTSVGQTGNPDTPNPPQTNGNTDNNLNLLIFSMAGLGILFVLIGAVIFAASTPMDV
jgi:hypothetical protein